MATINSTKNYAVFQKLRGNRPIIKGKLKKLIAAIQKENQLELHPMIVNGNMEIIDGQHRLEAARQLGLDIYYIQSKKVTDQHTVDSNVNQTTWSTNNYINFYAEREHLPAYIELLQMIEKTKLQPRALLTILFGAVTNDLLDFLKTGRFIFPESGEPRRIIDAFLTFYSFADERKIRPLSMFTNHYFVAAFRWLQLTTGFNEEIFYKKISSRWFDLRPQRTSNDWYNLLIDIYNHKNQDKLSLEYGRNKE